MLQGTSSLLFQALMLAGLIAVTSSSSQAAGLPADSAAKTGQTGRTLVQNYGKLQLSFEANQGQADPQVKFQSRGQGYSLFLTDKAAVFALSKRGREICQPERSEGRGSSAPSAKRNTACPTQTDTLNLELTHSNPSATPKGAEVLPGHANYFLGNDPAKWHTNVPTFSKVVYGGVYDGIDLVYYGNQRQLEYDFVVEPGSDPKQIELHFIGAEKLKLTPAGNLEVIAKNGQIAFRKPKIYQTLNGQRQPIRGSFTLAANHGIHFRVESYDRSRPLVIDPVLVYSTYLGGMGSDAGSAIAVDVSGHAYVAGVTLSSDFPVTDGVVQPAIKTENNFDTFISKFSPTGTALSYSTYLGGSGRDWSTGLALDPSGNVYITGYTNSTDFPVTSDGYQTTLKSGENNYNSFVTKLNPTGTAIDYSTYLGGSTNDQTTGIALDSMGNAYVTGLTQSTDFPVTSGAFQTSLKGGSGRNAFITKLNSTGTSLAYSTYLGGSGFDDASGIAIDAEGNAYVAGDASSADFPTTSGAFQTTNHGKSGNAFISKLNPTGTALVYSTYLGGSEGDGANGIAVDASGNAYVIGLTSSSNFPVTAGAFQTKLNSSSGGNAFVTKLNPTGTALVYSTYLGGSGQDLASGIDLDPSGSAWIAGSTNSFGFPVTSGALPTPNIGLTYHGFISQLDSTGKELVHSTYLGGSNYDSVQGIALDPKGNAYVTGSTESSDFPVTQGVFQTRLTDVQGSAFVTKLDLSKNPPPSATTTTLTSSISRQRVTQPVTFTATVDAKDSTSPFPGRVDFLVDGSKVATVALAEDTASYTTSALTVGTHTVTANYTGTSSLLASHASFRETIYMPTVARPSLSLRTGTYLGPQTEIISDATSGAAIHYTTDGTTPTAKSSVYTFPITLKKSVTVQAAAFENGYTPSPLVTATYTIQLQTATPTFSLSAGSYKGAQTVRLADTATGAKIYYTTNGATPTSSSTLYTATGILVGASETVKAIAIAPGDVASSTATAAYTIIPLGKAATPTFSLTAGTYTTPQSTTISDTTPGAVIHYTTDNSTPTTASPVYSGAISISTSETIKAIAVAPGYAQSLYGIAKYVIAPVAAAPVFNPPGGTYKGAQSISMSTTTPNTTVFYHIDGVSPTNTYISYTTPITISVTSTIRAFTMGSNNTTSPTTVATYTIQ